MKIHRLLFALSVAALLPGWSARTQTIVNWGDLNGSTSVVNNPPSNSVNISGGFSTSLDLTTARNPTVGSTYNTDSPIFFGAVDTNGTRQSSNNRVAITSAFSSNGSKAAIQMWASGATTYTEALFWKQSGNGTAGGFLNGFDTGTATTLGGATLQLTSQGSTTTNGGSTNVRFVISLGSSYYVSAGQTVSASSSVQTFSLVSPTATTWSAWDPTTISVIGSSVSLTDFSNLTGVGILYSANRGTNASSAMGNSIGYFNVTAVPEPTTYALGIVGLCVLIGIRRHRSHRLS